MKMIGSCTVLEAEERGGDTEESAAGAAVVVGVRLDSESRELLTWALVKVAQSGDRVIAVHVLNPNTESTSTLVSLVKTFDSMLAAYEGFCSLKQVDLKLKVCRGSPVRKILVQEAKSYGKANVIVGTSKVHHPTRLSVSVAKYCAKNLPRSFSVLAVHNGKTLFESKASDSVVSDWQDNDRRKYSIWSIHRSMSRRIDVPNNTSDDAATSKSDNQLYSQKFNSSESWSRGGNEEDVLSLVPVKSQLVPVSKNGWPLLRRLFFHNQLRSDKSSLKKSLMHWVLKPPSRQSVAAVYPHHIRSTSDRNEDHSLILDGRLGAMVPSATDTASSPSSTGYCLKSHFKEFEGITEKYSAVCRLFSYQELLLATSNFNTENVVGKGGSSQVYRGFLSDGKELAVKVLKPSEHAFRQFVSEIEIITTLHHKNTIALLGFCFEDNNLLLVYDFLTRGSLEENLHGNCQKETTFGWEDRYKVALGVAEALDYLHNKAVEPVIHRDVKSSNILLSDDFFPQLADFGLAIRASDSSCYMACADIAGTFGYLAPEYFMHGKVSDRIDVYAFGVILLELLSGRKPIDNGNSKGEESLVMWAKSIVKDGKPSQLLDPSLGGNYDQDQNERMVLAATLCIRRAPLCRPQISHVLKLLQGDMDAIACARQQVYYASEELDAVDGEELQKTNIQSHLNLALLDTEEEDSFSISSSSNQSVSAEDYLQGRWSRSSSME